jgi:hypothetical protein
MSRLWLALGLLSWFAGCRATRCEDLTPEPNAGKYRGGGSLGDEDMHDVSVEASAKQVVLQYTASDGSRIRAYYKVTKKVKKR